MANYGLLAMISGHLLLEGFQWSGHSDITTKVEKPEYYVYKAKKRQNESQGVDSSSFRDSEIC
jgi:hypothetical protein